MVKYLLLLLTSLPALALAQLHVVDAKVAPTAAGGSVAVRALLENRTSGTLVLVGASSPAARQVIMQAYRTDAMGLTRQIPLEKIAIEPGQTLLLAPGATEARLLGVQHTLAAGLDTALVLEYAGAPAQTLRLNIAP